MVGVLTGLKTVQSSSHTIHTRKEMVPEDVFCGGVQWIGIRCHPQVWVQAACSLCSHLCFRPLRRDQGKGVRVTGVGATWWGEPRTQVGSRAGPHRNILGSEEELPAEVGQLHMVHVDDCQAPVAPCTQSHEGEAFEQLTAYGTSTHLGQKRC